MMNSLPNDTVTTVYSKVIDRAISRFQSELRREDEEGRGRAIRADVLGAIKSRWMHLTQECYKNAGKLPAGLKRPMSAGGAKPLCKSLPLKRRPRFEEFLKSLRETVENGAEDVKRPRIDLEEAGKDGQGGDGSDDDEDDFADEFDDAEFVHATAAGQKASAEERQRAAAAEAREHEREERQKELERKEFEAWSKIEGELIDEERLLAEEDASWRHVPDPEKCPVKIYANVEVTEMGSNKRSKWSVSADRILVASARGEWLASSMEGSFLHLGAETAE